MKFEVGDRVEMIKAVLDTDHGLYDWCPPNGTRGTVVEQGYASESLTWVSWDAGANCKPCSLEDGYYGYYNYRLKKVEQESENNMNEKGFKVGDRVVFVNRKNRDDYRPNKWTLGTVTRADKNSCSVMWDEGANCWKGEWASCWHNGFGSYYTNDQIELHSATAGVCQKESFGDWIRCRPNEELAQIFAEHVDCCVCMNLMSRYGIEHKCDTGGCAEVWKKFLSKERTVQTDD